jgi:hypothetical protein
VETYSVARVITVGRAVRQNWGRGTKLGFQAAESIWERRRRFGSGAGDVQRCRGPPVLLPRLAFGSPPEEGEGRRVGRQWPIGRIRWHMSRQSCAIAIRGRRRPDGSPGAVRIQAGGTTLASMRWLVISCLHILLPSCFYPNSPL